jgi:VWFA-related protein
MTKKISATFLGLLLCGAQIMPVFSQTPAASPQQEETITVGTAAVQLEAIVSDKTGRRINGLTAADFQVLDEGKAQTLDFFTAIESSRVSRSETPGAATGGGADSKTTAPSSPLVIPYEGRHIALVFDDLNLSNDNFLRSRRAFADYINASLSPKDMVALISTGGALASLQQFTNDKQRLLSALNRIAMQSRHTESSDKRRWGLTDDEALRIDRGDNIAIENVKRRAALEDAGPQPSLAMGSGARAVDTGDSADSSIRTYAKQIVSEIGQVSRNNLATLKGLFRGMAELPGRKIVVLLTESFVSADGTSEDINTQLLQLIEMARKDGISVYAMDAAGLRTGNVTATEHITGSSLAFRNANPDLTLSSFEKLSGARKLVYGTGGELIQNTNDLAAGLQKAVEDSSSYYVLGFKPEALDNKFHRIAITVKGKPDLIVRSRRGYLAINQETVAGTQTELYAALSSPVNRFDIPLEVVANVVPVNQEQVVLTGLHVGRNYLTLPAADAPNQNAAYDIATYVFGAGRDKPVGGVERTITYDLSKPEERQKLKTGGAVLLVKEYTQLPPGIYQVRAVVREKATGLLGTSYQFFEIPDTKDRKIASLSSLLLTDVGQTAFDGANSFKPGVPIDLRYIIYNLPKNMAGVVQRVKLLDARGTQLFDSELALAVPAATDASQAPQATRFNLPAARGRYALIVTLKDAKGKIDVERRADLVIE